MNEVLFLKRNRIPYTDFQKYSYDESKGWQWLQRILFWILGKIGCHAQGVNESYEQVAFEPQKIGDSLMEQMQEVVSEYCCQPQCVLMGPQELQALDGFYGPAAAIHGPLSISVRPMKIMGMDIVIVPWMSGTLLLTEEIEKLSLKQVER